MPDGNTSQNGGGSSRGKRSRRQRKNKNHSKSPPATDNQSTASSSQTTRKGQKPQKSQIPPLIPPPPTPLVLKDPPQKVKLLKRDPDTPIPRNHINNSCPSVVLSVNAISTSVVTPPPLIASVMPLMAVELDEPPNSPFRREALWNNTSTPDKSSNVAGRQAEANKKQTQAYYFSENAGSAVSADTFQESIQYTLNNFPLEKNVPILIDRKYTLLITPTTSRCNGLFIRVKSQQSDELHATATGALLKLDSDDIIIRKACKETIERFEKVSDKCPTERQPFSRSSEEYLTSCLIRRLDDRQDAFPEAIYYCEKCDYHINTITHAKTHLESSTHFDDIKRQEQRETLLKKVPSPTSLHLKAVNKVLKETLDEYQQIRQKGIEQADNILNYLKTSVFPSIGCANVILKPFGSATYDVVLPDSDYNVAYTMDLPEGTPIFALLEKVRKQLVDDGHPADHSMEMGTPSTIIFSFETVRVRLCWMSCFNYRSQLYLSELMRTYVSLRDEVVQFLQLIRLWACKAGVDSKNKPRIGLPRYGFDLMSIHFLQQQGYLPVLHELFEGDTVEVEEQVTPDDSSEKCSKIPPEEAGQRRMRLMSRYEKDLEKIKSKFNLKKQWNMADLFIGFFRYYVGKNRDVVIQITQKIPMNRDVHRWNKKVLHVVDPFRGDNVLSIPKVSTWQPYYFNCLLTTFLYFAIPRTKTGSLVEVTLIHNKSVTSKKKVKETPKRVIEPSTPKQMTPITEEQYRAAADELAEEQEHERFMEQLRSRLVIDGIKYSMRKPKDYHIDDHQHQVYSNRALLRFSRVLDTKFTEKVVFSIEKHNLLNKKSEKWLNKHMEKKNYGHTIEEQQVQDQDKSNGIDKEIEKEVAEITEKIEDKLLIVGEARPQCSIEDDPVTTENGTSTNCPSSSPVKPEVEKTPSTAIPDDEKKDKPIEDVMEDEKKVPQSNHQEEDGEDGNQTLFMETTFEESPSKDVDAVVIPPKQSATFVKPTTITTQLSIDKQICSEEFFIKENIDVKDISTKTKKLKQSDFHYKFTTERFCDGYEMEMRCTHCDGSHCVENCPMMEIPPIVKYEARSPEDLKDIDDIIDKYYKQNILDEKKMRMMEAKKDELETFLKKNYRDDVSLTIFGSVMTGLSVNCSDIDICLRFGHDDIPPKDLTPKEVIQKTEEVLRRCKLAKRVQAIVTAKVPIVKFQMRLPNNDTVDVDISYYNILAIYNTALLREYTLWTPDSRFAKLALFIKKWAKDCDIGDASRGSLSSYAHIIMLVSYLQNCDPPVLPRLQEDFRSDNDEKRLIENWDTSYAQVEKDLQMSWPKNKESCAQLLIGYFDYYSRFDFRNFVIQCRREMKLSKMEKDWPRPLCVEDPFDLNHNLSSGVTKKMFVFIMKVFINSRAVFMSEKPIVARDINFLMGYQHQLLRKCNQGSAPTDRQCHQCHRIGHFVESCPQRAQQKEARRRYGSNSTNSSYRSNDNGGGFKNNSDDVGGDRLLSHKRTYHTRSYK